MVDPNCHEGVGPVERLQQPDVARRGGVHRVLQHLPRSHGSHAGVLCVAESGEEWIK